MTEPRKLRVFLCHTSQDKPIVRQLYKQLLMEDWIDPWLDEEKLLPGQNWDLEIERAVEIADVVIVCLSGKSLTKEGYVQRELKFVLDIALEKPEDNIFIIPLRLENIQPPRRLRFWQYTDYFPLSQRDLSYKKMRESFRLRFEQVGGMNVENRVLDTSRLDMGSNEMHVGNSDTDVYINKDEPHAFFMPFSVGIETVNNVYTPVIEKGEKLPAESKLAFSTSQDNQKAVEIHLLIGENKAASNNLSLGKFQFDKIPLSPKGEPQIEFQFKVNQNLYLSFVVIELLSGQIRNYPIIKLGGLKPPPLLEPLEKEDSSFSNIFKELFSTNNEWNRINQNYQQEIELSLEEAYSGVIKKFNFKDKDYKAKIPAGVDTGTKIRLSGVVKNADGENRDLYLIVSIAPHLFFTRSGSDIYVKYPISQQLARYGGELLVPKVGMGRTMKVEIPHGIKNTQLIRLADRGMPVVNQLNKFGDYYIEVDLYDVNNITRRQKDILSKINEYMK